MTTNIFSLIIVLGVLVFFHELGHFLVARFFNVGVEKFSLGFGPRLFGKKIGMTDYRVSAIPLGGYVKMVGELPDDEVDESQIELSFSHKNVWKRICIVAAGPVFNVILAILIFYFLFLTIGYETSRPIIGELAQDSPAVEAGLKSGDRVIAVGDTRVVAWEDIGLAVEESKGKPIRFLVDRNGEEIALSLTPEMKKAETVLGDETEIAYIGASPSYSIVLIDHVQFGTPAAKAGLHIGDQLDTIDGKKIKRLRDVSEVIGGSDGRELEFRVIRKGKPVVLKIIPEKVKTGENEVYRVGIQMGHDMIRKRLGPIDSGVESLKRTWFLTSLMCRALYKMVVQELPGSDLGGPILIAKIAGDQARAGVDRFISLIAFISLNLAILNLFPIPVLDGGHLMFYAIEIVKRSPVSIRTREVAGMIGMSLLMMLTVYVFYNDIVRFVFNN